jgi:hypothetical protein
VADDEALLALVASAPPHAHQPNVLLAAVHDLLLGGLDHPLAQVYAGTAGRDPVPLFRQVCLDHADHLRAVMADRRTQTNECGRSAVLALGLSEVASRLGAPLAVLDAGASAGLNLLVDAYRLDYGRRGALGPPRSPVQVTCEVRSPTVVVPEALPVISARLGIDRRPVDVRDPRSRRWLLACVWPDTGRLPRTAAALDLAASHPPEVLEGDMVDDLPAVLERLGVAGGEATPTVVTSWALAYLPAEERRRFVDRLAAAGRHRPVAWVSAEAAGVVEPLGPLAPLPEIDGTSPIVLGGVVFDGGGADARVLGLVHPHGAWVDAAPPAGRPRRP